jgi:hypothetical protein
VFLGHLDVRILGEQKFQLLAHLVYSDEKFHIKVMEGFIFDGGSIPRLFRGIECPLGGVGSKAFAIHDILYGTQLVGRYEADRVLYRALIDEGMDRVTAIAIYLAVRAGGSFAYDDISTKTMYWEYVNIHSKH